VQAASQLSSDRSPDPAGHTRRLFVALELPEPVRTATGAWAAAELGAVETLRPVRVDGLHVTLCFLGSTADHEVEAIGGCCRQACAGRDPLRLSIGGLLALPRRRPRAVTVRVDDEGHGQLIELQRGLAGALAAGGWYRPESRPFLAHVTVARIRSGTRLDARALAEGTGTGVAPLSERLPGAFSADVVTLFESRTQPGGAVYLPRARIELAA
jgi:RNA 2',3'-cyclic 3'-phosphodiesterase